MAKTLMEICTSLVVAQARAIELEPESMLDNVSQIYQTLKDLQQREQGHTLPAEPPEASIQRHHVVCLECGKAFTLLSNRHLALHNLTRRAYKLKYGLRLTQALSAQTLSTRRRKRAREMEIGKQLMAWRNEHQQEVTLQAGCRM